MTYASTNPYSGQVVAAFDATTDKELDIALDTAAAAFEAWRTTSIAERSRLLERAAEILIERTEPIARLITLEMGKLIGESRAEVQFAASILRYFATKCEEFLAPEQVDVLPTSGDVQIVNEAAGIILAIEPWNAPAYQAIRPFAPNAALGNVVLLKHAPGVPQSAAAIVQAVLDAGVPEGVLTNLYLTNEQSSRVIADPRVRGVTLTGSVTAGKAVAAQAGAHMKKAVMELGGSDAFIVLEDADLDLTLACAAPARLYNAGQICTSSKRMIVVESLYDQFVDRFIASLEGLRPGDPMDSATTLPPLSSIAAADRVRAQITTAVASGATAREVGKPVPDIGSFVQPTVLTDVARDNPAFHEEIFGPVPMIFRVANEEEAIALANDSAYGLAGSVWTRDIERGRAVARRIDTGAVSVNQPSGAGADVPIGGVKDSGFGFELGRAGMLEFARRTVVTTPTAASGSVVMK